MKVVFYKNNKQKGTTLLELLLYMSIVVIILSISGALSMNVLFGKARAVALEEVAANARISFHMMTEEINNSNSVNIAVGATSSSISLGMSDPTHNPVVFGIEDGKLWQEISLSDRVFLTTDNVSINNLEFKNVSFVGLSNTIRVSMVVESDIIHPRGQQTISKTFYTTVHKKQ